MSAMDVVHRFAVDQMVLVRPDFPSQPPRKARIERLEPYRGQPGYYVRYLDATEQWHCHCGWQSESTLTDAGAS